MCSVRIFLTNQLNKIRNNSFIKSILTLSAGVVVSQSVSLLTTPIISRIYTPEILGDFSLIISDATIIGTVVCLGMMSAIMIPKEDDEAKGLCRLLTLSICGLATIILTTAIALSGRWQLFTVNLDYRIACGILWLYVILSNISSVCYAYVNRQKMYKVLFWNPTFGTVSNAVVSIGLGLLDCGLWGYTCGNLLALLLNIIHMLRHVNPFRGKLGREYGVLRLLKKHKNFPLYQLPANVIGRLSQQLPVQLIKRLFGSAVLGSYSMCLTILGIPSRFLSAPVNRVYYQEATNRYNNGEDIGEFSYKILVTNIRIAIIPISLLIIFGKPLFIFVLGEKWAQAGSFASILGVYQLVAFCKECLSGNFVIIGKQKIGLLLSIANIIVTVLAFFVGNRLFHGNVTTSLICYSIAGIIYKLVDMFIFLIITGVRVKKLCVFFLKYIAFPSILATCFRILLQAAGYNM